MKMIIAMLMAGAMMLFAVENFAYLKEHVPKVEQVKVDAVAVKIAQVDVIAYELKNEEAPRIAKKAEEKTFRVDATLKNDERWCSKETATNRIRDSG